MDFQSINQAHKLFSGINGGTFLIEGGTLTVEDYSNKSFKNFVQDEEATYEEQVKKGETAPFSVWLGEKFDFLSELVKKGADHLKGESVEEKKENIADVSKNADGSITVFKMKPLHAGLIAVAGIALIVGLVAWSDKKYNLV